LRIISRVKKRPLVIVNKSDELGFYLMICGCEVAREAIGDSNGDLSCVKGGIHTV